MERCYLSSPAADCDDTFQESRAPDWYFIMRRAVRSIVAVVLCFSFCFMSMPVKAAELPSEVSDTSVSSNDLAELEFLDEDFVPEGYQKVLMKDGSVYYVSSYAEDIDGVVEENLFPLYDTYEEFIESPVYVTRYEYEILKKLEYCQYAFAIDIALLFLLFFKKK